MIDIIISMSRYIYIIIIFTFLVISIYLCGNKKEKDVKNNYIYLQILTLIYNIISFIILFAKQSNNQMRYNVFKLYLIFFITLIVYYVLIDFAFKNYYLLMWCNVFFLLSISISILTRLNVNLGNKQVLWVLIASMISILIYFMFRYDTKIYKLKYVFLVMSYVLLIIPFKFGEEIYGAFNWVNINGLSIQPSEFVKILLILYLASAFNGEYKFLNVVTTGIGVLGLIVILIVERDLGTALIYFITYLIMVYCYSIKSIYLFGGLLTGIVASYVSYSKFVHVKTRIEAWVNPWKSIDDKGYQIAQSLFAIADGSWTGVGLTLGMPEYIPIVTTDFIFSAICEEFGNLFSIMLIIMYLVLFNIILLIINKNTSTFYRQVIIGIAVIFSFQTFLIIGGVIKFIPMTGVTMPFVSYGGSSLLVSFILLTFIQIAVSNQKSMDKV